jgi:bifunctional DNA-binding transcriptional regulator/antitoxin component of YhaV-PrlF toxin-antitoxin module
MKPKVIPPDSVQTVLNISNTDIVTMLIVKQKEFLKKKRPALIEERKLIEAKYVEKLKEALEKKYKFKPKLFIT